MLLRNLARQNAWSDPAEDLGTAERPWAAFGGRGGGGCGAAAESGVAELRRWGREGCCSGGIQW